MTHSADQPDRATVMLAIETSQRAGSVALRSADGTMHHEPLRTGAHHEDDLLPAIDRLFENSRLSPRDLDVVAVSIGPGGFTGLRIAVTTAKIFAETLGAAVIGVPSAMVAAERYNGVGPIAVALAAKRKRLWWTVLDRDDAGIWRISGEPGSVDDESVPLTGLSAVLGDQCLPAALRARCERRSLPVVEPQFDARAVLAVADRLHAAGEVADPLRLTPLYARPPEAVSLWDRRQSDSTGRAT